jgi:bisphosphoglycerate-dependent phosphoglycerate mutase
MKYLSTGIIMISLALMISSPAAWARDEAVSLWVEAPIQVDGSEQDWAVESLINEKKYSVDYGFKNDGDYLYSVFIFHDPEYLSTIQQTGMTLWLNAEGKKKKHHGIRFRQLAIPAEKYIELIESQGGALTEIQKQQIRSKKQHVVPNVFIVNKDEEFIRPDEEYKLAVFNSTQSQDRIVYEFAVPLEKPADDAFGIGVQPGQSIKVAFEWGGMTEEMKQARLSRMGQMSTRGGASAGGVGDMTSERQVNSGSADMASIRRNAPKQYCLWVDVVIAEKQ